MTGPVIGAISSLAAVVLLSVLTLLVTRGPRRPAAPKCWCGCGRPPGQHTPPAFPRQRTASEES